MLSVSETWKKRNKVIIWIVSLFEGLAKPHNHIGSSDLYAWGKQACLDEVRNYQTGDEINYSALAKQYPITVVKTGKMALNQGQIVKQYLVENGIDVDQFQNRYSIKRVKRSRKIYLHFVSFYNAFTNWQFIL